MSDPNLEYLRERLQAAEFRPYPWEGEDRNLGSFCSTKEALVEWWCQPPGVPQQPYRDRCFYARELAMLSRVIKPEVVVEFGTSLGMGTCLLRWLNPRAWLVTVDANAETFLPGDVRVPMGQLAMHQGIKCGYVRGNSWDYSLPGTAQLCFIDADHSYSAVAGDSMRAWNNRFEAGRWAIAWHDHQLPDVQRAVAEFCEAVGVELQSRPDSDTVWIWGGVH